MKKVTVSIGIPAYNESSNILYLLDQLFQQKIDGFILEKILVYSDGSTDSTERQVSKYKNKSVFLLKSRKRQGKMYGVGQISKNISSDILVLLDADIIIKDDSFIRKLITPIKSKNADLTSTRISEVNKNTYLEKILAFSMAMKRVIYERTYNGDNIYTCHGRARALSKKYYTALDYPKEIAGEDAYMYLFAKQNTFKYAYVINTEIYYMLPTSFRDHKKQSLRFIKMKKELYKRFGMTFVQESMKIPIQTVLTTMMYFFIKNPLYFLSYLAIHVYIIIQSIFTHENKALWSMATSSKSMKGEVLS